MKVRKNDAEFGSEVYLIDSEEYLKFSFGGNGDLYWTIHSSTESDRHSFTVTKENYGVYRLFDQLYRDIDEINIFDEEEDPFGFQSETERREYIEREREKYREYGYSGYHELYDKENKTITWYSDETAHEVSNILRIKKNDDTFDVEFQTQPNIYGYDEDSKTPYRISIRFRNSGSSYDPFNVPFMRMYFNMDSIDDVNDYGHQIDVEEVLYEQGKRLVKSNN